jgi:ABC-type proline/glycine betaine transport system ATPase subunit
VVVVASVQRLATTRLERLDRGLTAREGDQLQDRLGLTVEQRQASELGCGEQQLVVIEGQAGTGKSTILRGIARVHQAEGRDILV